MEAETFLSEGHSLRMAVEERETGWQPLAKLARTWQPNRLKGILVSPDFGTPFLAATQVFDIRPIPRKWLALERTAFASDRYVTSGTILVTCSGSVGRATIAHAPHEKTLISHDLLRIAPFDRETWGWIYAYLRSPQARAIMTGAQYGHIIKHLEPEHLDGLPVPDVSRTVARDFCAKAEAIVSARDRAHKLTLEAESKFAAFLGEPNVSDWGETGFQIKSSAISHGRRRLEAIPHNPGVRGIRRLLGKNGREFASISSLGFDVWLPTRFKRIPAQDGVPFLDSADLFETNPDITKFIADGDFGDPHRGRVRPSWLLLARSGQTYGINGSATLATKALEGSVISDHVIRVAPRATCSMRTGYLLTALSHPKLGRPLIKSIAYGSSIPEIDPGDFSAFEVIRCDKRTEEAIADLAEESAHERARADILEHEIAEAAGKLVASFLNSPSR